MAAEAEGPPRAFMAFTAPLVLRALAFGLCLRCSLRIGGPQWSGHFSLPDCRLREVLAELRAEVGDAAADPPAPVGTCPCCLGILQQVQELADAIVSTWQSSPYQRPRQYNFAIGIPKAVYFRNVAAVVAVLDPPDTENSPVSTVAWQAVDLKDALQEALRGAVGPELGAAYEAERGLAVTVDLRHPAGDSGILEFFRQLPAHLHARAAPLATVEEVSINIIKDTLGCMKVAEFRQFSPLTPQTWGVSGDITWELRLSHEPIYLMGRYCKWHRKLAQTPWVLNGRRLLEDSVQELIGLPVLPLLYPTVDLTDPALREPAPVDTEASAKRAKLEADSLGCHAKGKAFNTYCTAPVEALYKFHACGREDVDVRMLGTGRPFVIEATNPHVTSFSEEDFARMMAVVAADPEERVTIHELRLGSLAEFDTLNAHVDRRRKGYRCVVWAARDLSRSPELVEAINRCTELVLAQMTPIRVMHRRSLLTRKKVIHSITCEVISAHWLVVDVVTSAGTYVKEFVHGDCGRTVPSLASMLQCRTEIIQLDVTEVL